MHRLVTAVALAITAALIPSSALAAPAFLPTKTRTLSAPAHACSSTTYRAPMLGFLSVRDDGTTRGDWDLTVRDARTKRALATSNAFGSNELAQTFTTAGQRLVVTGCHVSGRDRTFPVQITFSDAKPPKAVRQSLVRVKSSDPGVLRRLDSLGFDVTENVQKGHADVVVPSPAKLSLLSRLGLPFAVRTRDLARHDLKTSRADAAYGARMGAAGSPLPSGRTGYRTLADFQDELKALVKDHAGLVRPVTLGQTFQGRAIQGIEIAKNVDAASDGRPTFLLVGLHHAREWPSAEIAMEFAHYLVDGYGSDDEVTSLVTRERIVIVPIINVDGFNASRGTAADGYIPDPADSTGAPEGDTAEGVALPFGGNLAYRRKNCDGVIPNDPANAQQNLPCYYQVGVDPNRNYGQNWGGVGASSDPNTQSYRGAGQWSEPETQAVWHWSQAHNVTFMMTLHNVAALVLRPPGVHTDGLAPDEQRMKQLGDAMAADTGYTSQYGWQLYDTSGTTEDWQYGGQSAFGYTIELGPEGGQFHMPYEVGVVQQWTGDKSHQGRGMRAALLKAAESAGNPGDHSIIEGYAPAGAVLRVKKSFTTESSPICTYAQGLLVAGSPLSPLDCVAPGDTTSTPDHLDYTMVVPPSSHYEWHVTPSTRPFVAHKVTPGGYADTAYKTDSYDATGDDIPSDDEAVDDNLGTAGDESKYSAQRRFTVTPGEAGNQLVVNLSWDIPAQDFDLDLFHVNPDGTLTGAGSSGNPNGVDETVTLPKASAGDYVARIVYYTTGAPQTGQGNDWHLTVSRFQAKPDTVASGREYWTMSCETAGGQVLESREVYVERGQAVNEDFGCGGPVPKPGAGSGAVLGQTRSTPIHVPTRTHRTKASKRARCLKRAAKVKSKAKRRAAVKRCKKRYPAKAKHRAHAKKKAHKKHRAHAKKHKRRHH